MSRVRPNFLYSIVSVALVLFLLGFFGLTLGHARRMVTIFKERVDIWLELRPGANENEISRLEGALAARNFVRPGSVEFISRKQAAQEMKNELGDTSMLADLPDLLYDVLRFNVRENWLSPDSLELVRAELRADSLVSDVFYEQNGTANIGQNLEKLGWLTLAIGFLFIFVAITLIHNTIRLALYSNRFLIKNQELVGATWGFIARPYIFKGIKNGLWSAALAIGGLAAIRFYAYRQMPELRELENPLATGAVFAVLLLLGILISGLSTWFVVRKFLGTRLDELY